MESINERLDKLKELIQQDEFLNGTGLSNEVNIRMFCYDEKDEMAVRHFTQKLSEDKDLRCRLIIKNLYDIFLSICEDKHILNAIPKMEETKGPEFLLNQLHKTANVTRFVEKLDYGPREKGKDVLMLTGVGEVYPYMRAHALLDAIQPVFNDIPILVMYPGVFDGRHVKLFDKLEPKNYYRAFNVV